MPKRATEAQPKQAFRKFKLVPADEDSRMDQLVNAKKSVDLTALEQYIRKYDPKIKAMANSYSGMQDALYSKNVRHTPSQRLHMYNANRARIHRMRKGPEQPAEATRQLEEQVQDMVKKGADPESDEILKERLVKGEEAKVHKAQPHDIATAVVPKNYQAKFRNLVDLTSNKIRANDRGEVVINGRELAGTSFSDVMRALYVNQKGHVSGLSEVVDELKRIGISPGLLSSARAKSLYTKSKVDKIQTGSGFKPRRVLRLY